MFTRKALLQSQHLLRRTPTRAFSTTELPNGIKLAYDLHEPTPSTTTTSQNAPPIIFIHGLFGSKKNNRSMSKYALSPTYSLLIYLPSNYPSTTESSPAP